MREAQVLAWSQPWERASCDTAPADRPRAEAAITALHLLHGRPAPRFLWVGSPLSGALAIGILWLMARRRIGALPPTGPREWDGLPAEARCSGFPYPSHVAQSSLTEFRRCRAVEEAVSLHLRAQLGPEKEDYSGLGSIAGIVGVLPFEVGPLPRELRLGFRTRLKAELGLQVCQEICRQLGGPALAAIDPAALWGQLAGAVETTIDQSWLYGSLPGQAAAPLVCPTRFNHEVLGVPYVAGDVRRVELWSEIVRSCGEWWSHPAGICIVCERPDRLCFDDRKRLHHPTESAVSFRDGTRLHAWQGTLVPERWITAPEREDPTVALTWSNMEQRRAALEILGWGRILERLPAKVIDRNPDPALGTLMEVDLPGFGPIRFLRVRCGTGREFVLCVPPDMRTAHQANAWTYALTADEYSLEARA